LNRLHFVLASLAVPVAEGILFSHQNALSHFAMSEAGVLAVVRATAVSTAQKLVAVDRTGTVQVLREHLKTFGGPRLSPDGRQVALSLMDGSKPPDVWLFDLERGSLSRFTFGPASNFNPVWTPDGRRIVYSSERPVFDLYAKASDATTPEVPVAVSSSDKYANAISPDGQLVLATSTMEGAGDDLIVYALSGTGEPRAIVSTATAEGGGAFSPDGAWLAYGSDESDPGAIVQIYVRSFPDGATRHQVSADGGTEPVWARKGRELFYRADRQLMAVSIGADGRPGKPQPLFELDLKSCHSTERTACYDVSPDGRHFYMLQPSEPARAQASFDVVLNVFEELKRIAK
jgi:eukaryotic-like serine/threonine-protein kinase